MKSRFILFKRAGVYYSEDTTTGKQHSLRTKDKAEAQTLLHSKNEAHRQPVLNLQIARTYLTATDPLVANRTWQTTMDEMTKTKTGPTRARHIIAMKDKAFDIIRNLPILETHSVHFLKVLELGSVSTNVYLRRIHNFALDMNWLAWSILPKRQWQMTLSVDQFAEAASLSLRQFTPGCLGKKPGLPVPNDLKYFATSTPCDLKQDVKWLGLQLSENSAVIEVPPTVVTAPKRSGNQRGLRLPENLPGINCDSKAGSGHINVVLPVAFLAFHQLVVIIRVFGS